jgi:hypothetical protein
MLQNLQAYFSAVAVQLLTILAGTAATVFLDQFRRLARRKKWIIDEWPDLWWLYIVMAFTCFASFQAWEDEHTSNLARREDVLKQKLLTAVAESHADEERQDTRFCQFQKDVLNGAVARQGVNFNGQQGTLNTCVVALAKINTPEPLITVPYLLGKSTVARPDRGRDQSSQAVEITSYLLITNKKIIPTRVLVSCDVPIRSASGQILQREGVQSIVISNGGSGPVSENEYRVAISQDWTPLDPLVIHLEALGSKKCVFTPE